MCITIHTSLMLKGNEDTWTNNEINTQTLSEFEACHYMWYTATIQRLQYTWWLYVVSSKSHLLKHSCQNKNGFLDYLEIVWNLQSAFSMYIFIFIIIICLFISIKYVFVTLWVNRKEIRHTNTNIYTNSCMNIIRIVSHKIQNGQMIFVVGLWLLLSRGSFESNRHLFHAWSQINWLLVKVIHSHQNADAPTN